MYSRELEEATIEMDWHNKFLESAGVTDLAFVLNFFRGSYDVGVYNETTSLTAWFSDWREAEKYCKTHRPDANWETTGW